MKFIVLPLYDHVSEDEAVEFAAEINAQLQPGIDAYVAYGESLPKPVWMEVKP